MTWSYIGFNVIRFFFRFIACITDCMMMNDAVKGEDPSNRERHQTNLNILQFSACLCLVLWILKFILSIIEPQVGRKIEQLSDCVSFVTLWIGEIPHIGFHLFFVCKHAQKYHRNYRGGIIFLSICKLVERILGFRMKYDWRNDKYTDDSNHCYFMEVIIKLFLSLAMTVV